MSIKQGKRKMRDYTVEFQTLMNRLHGHDKNWMVNIFIWEQQPHIARSVSAAQPATVLEAINAAESIDHALKASQKNRLTCNLRSKEGKNLKQSWRSSKNMGPSKTEILQENFKAVGKYGRCVILKYQMIKVQCNKIQFRDLILSGWEPLHNIKIFPLIVHSLLGMKR